MRLFALLLIDTVTVVLVPAAKLPPVDDSVTHDCVLPAVQTSEGLPALPVFVNVYETLGGLNGPPTGPEEVRPPVGETDNAPVVPEGNTIKLTGRVVFPILAGACTIRVSVRYPSLAKKAARPSWPERQRTAPSAVTQRALPVWPEAFCSIHPDT